MHEFECSGNVINIDKKTMGSSSISRRRMKLKGLQGKTILHKTEATLNSHKKDIMRNCSNDKNYYVDYQRGSSSPSVLNELDEDKLITIVSNDQSMFNDTKKAKPLCTIENNERNNDFLGAISNSLDYFKINKKTFEEEEAAKKQDQNIKITYDNYLSGTNMNFANNSKQTKENKNTNENLFTSDDFNLKTDVLK